MTAVALEAANTGRFLVRPALFDWLVDRVAADTEVAGDRDLATRVVDQALAFLAASATSPRTLAPSRLVDVGWHTFLLQQPEESEVAVADVWGSVPGVVRQAVERHVGPVTAAEAVAGGKNNDLAAVVHGNGGPVFVKAVRGISPAMRWLRDEITAGVLADGIAPAVIFSEEVRADDLWLIVGFEYLPGRPADLAVGSADLAVVGRTLDRISALPAPGVLGLHERWTVPDWWSRVREAAPEVTAGWDVERMDRWAALAPAAVEGDRLEHTDLHADQFILGPDGTVHVIDWGFPGAAAPWVDTAFLVIRLVDAGHCPADAQAWAAERPGWTPDGDALTAFAVFVAGLWTYRAVTEGADGPWVRSARDYAAWRVGVAVSPHCAPAPT